DALPIFRLKYAGLPPERILIRPDLREAVRAALHGQGEAVYFLATYTALWPVEKELRRLLDRKEADYADSMPSLS
ncbi:MurT ligase domain-containing protein, partial [Desulforudis sp. 1190]|uniref:MurT ligase domain-containing protein n=1 Tax=Desulforudis sp. 1190 TaxID=3416136 RepID=UPI003CE78FC2